MKVLISSHYKTNEHKETKHGHFFFFFTAVDVRLPSMCYEYILLPLVTKETALACGKAENRYVGKLN